LLFVIIASRRAPASLPRALVPRSSPFRHLSAGGAQEVSPAIKHWISCTRDSSAVGAAYCSDDQHTDPHTSVSCLRIDFLDIEVSFVVIPTGAPRFLRRGVERSWHYLAANRHSGVPTSPGREHSLDAARRIIARRTRCTSGRRLSNAPPDLTTGKTIRDARPVS
jgi:hypothetical protein